MRQIARLRLEGWQTIALVAGLVAATCVGVAMCGRLGGAIASVIGAALPSRTADAMPRGELRSSTGQADVADGRLAAIGREIFFDTSFSQPEGTSCATCHDPAHAFAGNNGSTTGVARGSRAGHFARRNTPSVLYLAFVQPFHFHWEEDVPLPDAFGGFFWDGREDSLSRLIRQPLFNPDEMNSGDAARVASKVRMRDYARELRAALVTTLSDPEETMTAMGKAVEAFLKSPAMAPFSSKYDDYVRGRVKFSEIEAFGLALFKDPAKGNCATCHRLNDTSGKPERSLFTDYGFEVVAVPRNRQLLRNEDVNAFDLGLCERSSPRAAAETRFCGAFRTPSLRNVAVRSVYMHNGAFHALRDVVAFYATRGTATERWYRDEAYDDLPEKFRINVNVEKVPYDREKGQKPRLDDREIDAIVAFLHTLSDRVSN